MRIYRAEDRKQTGSSTQGIPTNGESVKVRYPASVLLFIRRYQNKAEPLLYATRTFRYGLKCNLAEQPLQEVAIYPLVPGIFLEQI